MKNNIFGQEIPEIKELLKDRKVKIYVEGFLLKILNYLEVENPKSLIKKVMEEASNYKNLKDYEKKIHLIFDKNKITQSIPNKLMNRSEIIFDQIKSFLKGYDIFDFGCGDGKVGELISKEQSRHVLLSDIYENGNIKNIGLPFIKIKQNQKIPFPDKSFDTILLLTVLHHSDNPFKVIKEAKRITRKGGKIIVLESVYGVKDYGNLTNEQQRLVNIFFDHFYNRIIHFNNFKENKVNVPFNFKTPEDWKKFFRKLNLSIEKMVFLGFDQPIVPEYHVLYVMKIT